MRLVVRSKIGKKLFYILNHTYGNNASVTSIGSKWPVYFRKSNLVKVGYVNLNRKELKMNEQKLWDDRKELEAKIDKRDKLIAEMAESYTAAQAEIEELEDHNKYMTDKYVRAASQISDDEVKISELEKEIAELKAEAEKHLKMVVSIEKYLEKLTADRKALVKCLNKYADEIIRTGHLAREVLKAIGEG